MARRKKKKSRSRRFRGINLWKVGESIVQANILTQGLFNANPLEFVIGRDSGGYGRRDLAISNTPGQTKIGLGELLGLNSNDGTPQQVRQKVWDNFMNRGIPMVGSAIAVKFGFKFAQKMTRGLRRDINAGFKMVGIQNEVKV